MALNSIRNLRRNKSLQVILSLFSSMAHSKKKNCGHCCKSKMPPPRSLVKPPSFLSSPCKARLVVSPYCGCTFVSFLVCFSVVGGLEPLMVWMFGRNIWEVLFHTSWWTLVDKNTRRCELVAYFETTSQFRKLYCNLYVKCRLWIISCTCTKMKWSFELANLVLIVWFCCTLYCYICTSQTY